MVQIRKERAADGLAIEQLLDLTFGQNRKSKISYRFRDGVSPVETLSTVAEDHEGELTGTIRYWPVMLSGHGALSVQAEEPERFESATKQRAGAGDRSHLIGRYSSLALLLGPLATHPNVHGRGIGRALVFSTLAEARAQGHRTVFLVGEQSYYARFGFGPVPPNIVMPGETPSRLLYRALDDSSLPVCPCELLPATGSAGAMSASGRVAGEEWRIGA